MIFAAMCTTHSIVGCDECRALVVRDDPMPVFVLKAKDALALETVAVYRDLCERAGLVEQAAQVLLAFVEMDDWRRRNGGAIKMPDHKHVPADTSTANGDADG